MYEYPFQIASAFSRNRDGSRLTTLGIEARFGLEAGSVESETREDVSPLEMHEGYSRFAVTLISKTAESKVFVVANIPAVDDIDEIIANTRCAQQILMSERYSGAGHDNEKKSDSLPPAYTVTMTMGSGLKGKTPAELLLEGGSNMRQKLLEQVKFLKKNVEKFPDNQKQIDAIAQAIALFDGGKLSEAAAKDSARTAEKTVTIYEADFKPLRSTLDENGTVIVYGIEIACTPAHKYPYTITIKNKREKWDEKKQSVIAGANSTPVEISMVLPERKWLGITGKLEREMTAFETCAFSAQYRKATLASDYNYKQAKSKQAQSHA